MGSVNPTTPAPLPATPAAPAPAPAEPAVTDQGGWGIVDGLTAMGNSLGSTMTDAATFVGVDTYDDGSLRAGVDPLGFGGFVAATATPTAVMALRNRVDPLTGASTRYIDRLGAQAASNSIRITPTLVSAILGPAVADGVTMIAPNLVKKYKDTKEIKDATARKQAEKDNQSVKIQRAIAGGVAVGLAAGVVFLLKPDIFKKFQAANGSGLVDRAIKGTTKFTVDGQLHKLAGVLDATQIRSAMAAAGKTISPDSTVNIVKTIAPMAKDAVFSNRAIMGTAGALGTFLLANKAAGEEDPDRKRLMWGLTAAAGAMTVGATYGIGKLTQRSAIANGGAGGLLAKNELLMKPNIEWIKKYATTIAPITAVPAGTAASQYFNIVDDFDDITAPRSPFRK